MGTPAALVLGVLLGVLVTAGVAVIVAVLRRRARERRAREEREKREAHQQLSTIAQVMHFAVDAAPTAVAVVDTRQDVILGNRMAENLGVVVERGNWSTVRPMPDSATGRCSRCWSAHSR